MLVLKSITVEEIFGIDLRKTLQWLRKKRRSLRKKSPEYLWDSYPYYKLNTNN